jgi:SDR family mycofactocin-dependent oxidoreductase
MSGKVALVTGAARGQGRSHAVRLAEEGADIIAVDICAQIGSVRYPMATPADLAETAALIEGLDRRVLAQEADVRDINQLAAVVTDGVAELGRLDVVCANAGIASYGHSWELTTETWQDMIDVNLTGVWNTVRSTVPVMIQQAQGGSLILTSSTGGLVAIPNASHYSAAKTGVVALARALAQELGPHFIRVNTIHPTGVDTDMLHNDQTYGLFVPDGSAAGREVIAPMTTAQNAIPVPWVEPRDISNAVLFLASDESRYVTGCALTVDAGATIKYPGT